MNKSKIEILLAKARAVLEALDQVISCEEFDEAEYPTYEDEERFGGDGELEEFAQAIRDAQDGIEEACNALDKCINPQDYDNNGDPLGDADDDFSDLEECGSDDDKYNDNMAEYNDMYAEEETK
ncbi:MAG: hypothetical protein A2Y16_05565 [Tenericutes bacterium GWF2_57_13]|nr:MAG: hypothetical protein A2Y16_05565 [Tenericutes bacterium GWF2_57_13]